jgi:hypothetical protein
MNKVTKQLKEIAEKIKSGANYKDFDAELDRLLQTEMVERDLEAEKEFERRKKPNVGPW